MKQLLYHIVFCCLAAVGFTACDKYDTLHVTGVGGDGNSIILDLASAPGGTDFEAARAFGIRALTAPGLPGKWSPQTAAEAVRDAVYNILEDEKA